MAWPGYGDRADIVALTNEIEARLNDKRDAVTPMARVANNQAQSLANGTETLLTYGVIQFDNDGMWNPAQPDRLTCRTAGIYRVEWTTSFAAASATGNRIGVLRVSGSAVDQVTVPLSVGASSLRFNSTLRLNINDYVQVSLYQSSGGAINTHSQAYPVLALVHEGLGS